MKNFYFLFGPIDDPDTVLSSHRSCNPQSWTNDSLTSLLSYSHQFGSVLSKTVYQHVPGDSDWSTHWNLFREGERPEAQKLSTEFERREPGFPGRLYKTTNRVIALKLTERPFAHTTPRGEKRVKECGGVEGIKVIDEPRISVNVNTENLIHHK